MALAYVAKGAIDCFQMDHLQPWDVAAGVLIICEAGGTVIDTKGALIKWVRERKNLFFLNLKERLLHVILRYFNIFFVFISWITVTAFRIQMLQYSEEHSTL